jgi:hypothetical protein
VTNPEATEAALEQATSILERDARNSRLPQMEVVAQECRTAASDGNAAERVAVCRKLATRLARLASTLATEVQEQTRKSKGEVKPSVTPARPPAVASTDTPVADRTTPIPSEVPVVPPTARPQAVPAPDRPARPKFDLTHIRVAVSPEEREAVTAALGGGRRFAEVNNGTLIDTRLNLMWAAAVGPAGSHAAAVIYAGQCRLGGYADWRLPRPEELQHFLAGGGREFVTGLGGHHTRMALWTSETSRRWFFIRQATVVQAATGSMEVISAARSDVPLLVMRTAIRVG